MSVPVPHLRAIGHDNGSLGLAGRTGGGAGGGSQLQGYTQPPVSVTSVPGATGSSTGSNAKCTTSKNGSVLTVCAETRTWVLDIQDWSDLSSVANTVLWQGASTWDGVGVGDRSISFSHDGLKAAASGFTKADFFTLTTPFDPSTATHDQTVNFASGWRGVVSPDGNFIICVQTTDAPYDVRRYDADAAWDFTSFDMASPDDTAALDAAITGAPRILQCLRSMSLRCLPTRPT